MIIETGYADLAIESFRLFDRLQQEGVIPAVISSRSRSRPRLRRLQQYGADRPAGADPGADDATKFRACV